VSSKKSQNVLLNILSLILHGIVVQDFRHPDLRFQETQNCMELDIYFPEHALAFEYQGEHHYQSIYRFGNLQAIQSRDAEKKKTCLAKGITLIEIPYWTKLTAEVITPIVKQVRPDVLKNSHDIPNT